MWKAGVPLVRPLGRQFGRRCIHGHHAPLSADDLVKAHQRVHPHVRRTPVLYSEQLNALVGDGAKLFFKCENLQSMGAFKIRGASNAVFSLTPEQAHHGVVTHSSGNHGAALALAAQQRGVPAHIVMPENSSKVKIEAVQSYGAHVILCKPTLQARESTANEVMKRTGATMVHPYNDLRVIAGASTATIELLQQGWTQGGKPLDIVCAAVGGGGLLSGAAMACHHFSPNTAVIAQEPKNADDAYQSFHGGTLIPVVNPNTVADGLRTSLGDITFNIIKNYVKDIVTVEEASILESMQLIWKHLRVVVEPSAAVSFAALLEKKIDISHKHVGIILCGGNVDLAALPWAKMAQEKKDVEEWPPVG